MGNFNEVRSIDERFGSMFNQSSSRLFNLFITSSGLVDVKLEGYSFTWAHPSATKMSKLDRFLVSEDVFKDHFETRFKQLAHGRFKLNISFPNRLSTDQVAYMDRSISRDEIRVAVWNCGDNKSPGPDGYTFESLGDIGVVTKILANRLATVILDLVSDIQSTFVANRQILDGPFILNELLAWCKRKNKQAMIFKVDFAKAYNSVR
nr:RNA-directed DNA polymerase, eukaryota [Tanacetum cinerariifolium]